MKIYTKTGDQGETGLFGGPRVRKDSPRVEAYGAVDELNALMGLVRAAGVPGEQDALLQSIQEQLFEVGAQLATPAPKRNRAEPIGAGATGAGPVAALEAAIDRHEADLPPLKQFILPGGSTAAATLHVARCVCRRAERRVVRLAVDEPIAPDLVIYLNRLSDLLFVLARAVNQTAGIPDTPWRPDSRSSGG